MSLCYSSKNDDDTRETFSVYPPLFTQSINFNINETEFADNSHTIFRSCGGDVSGFNTFTNKYWGKKSNKCMCYFHFQLSVNEITDEKSIITITLISGKKEEVTKLLGQLTDVLNSYKIILVETPQIKRTDTKKI